MKQGKMAGWTKLQFFHLIILGIIFSLSPKLAQASELDDFFPELPHVISANRLNQSILQSPSSVTIIDSDMIEAAGVVDLVDVFRLVPGFQVAHMAGERYTASYHGGGWELGNWLQVLVNGRSTYLPSFSIVDWDTIGVHIEDIEKIEVIRSPSGSAYGSNSFSAAINIITKPIGSDKKITAKTRHGTDNENYQFLRYQADLNSNHQMRISASTRSNNGLDDVFDSQYIQNINLDTYSNLSSHQSLESFLYYSNGFRGAVESRFLDTRKLYTKTLSGHLRWQYDFSSANSLKISAYHSYRNQDDDQITDNLSELLGTTPEIVEQITGAPDQGFYAGLETFKAKQTDFDIQFSGITDSQIQYALSTGYRYNTLASDFYFFYKKQVEDSLFRSTFNLALPLTNRLTFNSGLLIEKNSNFKTLFSPRGSLNLEIIKDQSIKISASQANRIPSLMESNMDSKSVMSNGFVVNDIYDNDPNIKPSTINSCEFSYQGTLQSMPLSWNISAYHDEITDYIWTIKVKEINDITDQLTRIPKNSVVVN